LRAEIVLLIRHWDVALDLVPEVVGSTRFQQDSLYNTTEIFTTFSNCSAPKPGMNFEFQISSAQQGQLHTGNIFVKMSQKLIGKLQIILGLLGRDLHYEYIF